MREIRAGRTDCAFMVGSGLIIYVAWLASTAAGLGFRNQIADPASFGLDFMLPAFFVALMIGMWRGRADLLPGLAAAAVAVGVHKLGGGHWYILAGALTGCAVGAWRHGC
ncbi:MAG: hypothetical protein FJX52_02880 [Alphaproteobacteria bacterium]|nr:hypothetical protein [Alphaproteobacteria bacterium]